VYTLVEKDSSLTGFSSFPRAFGVVAIISMPLGKSTHVVDISDRSAFYDFFCLLHCVVVPVLKEDISVDIVDIFELIRLG